MLKFILLVIALWMAARLVGRLIRISFISGRYGIGSQDDGRSATASSSGGRRAQVEEAEFEVIDSRIRKDE